MKVRTLRDAEGSLLDDFLYLAIHVPPGDPMPPRSLTKTPELRRFVSNFGRAGDIALVAEDCGKLVGAAWSRLYPDEEPAYGTIDADTPNLALAAAPEHRRSGVGTALLEGLFRRLTEAGYTRVSLSVDTTNPAQRLYERVGFITHHVAKSERVMVRRLLPQL